MRAAISAWRRYSDIDSILSGPGDVSKRYRRARHVRASSHRHLLLGGPRLRRGVVPEGPARTRAAPLVRRPLPGGRAELELLRDPGAHDGGPLGARDPGPLRVRREAAPAPVAARSPAQGAAAGPPRRRGGGAARPRAAHAAARGRDGRRAAPRGRAARAVGQAARVPAAAHARVRAPQERAERARLAARAPPAAPRRG